MKESQVQICVQTTETFTCSRFQPQRQPATTQSTEQAKMLGTSGCNAQVSWQPL